LQLYEVLPILRQLAENKAPFFPVAYSSADRIHKIIEVDQELLYFLSNLYGYPTSFNEYIARNMSHNQLDKLKLFVETTKLILMIINNRPTLNDKLFLKQWEELINPLFDYVAKEDRLVIDNINLPIPVLILMDAMCNYLIKSLDHNKLKLIPFSNIRLKKNIDIFNQILVRNMAKNGLSDVLAAILKNVQIPIPYTQIVADNLPYSRFQELNEQIHKSWGRDFNILDYVDRPNSIQTFIAALRVHKSAMKVLRGNRNIRRFLAKLTPGKLVTAIVQAPVAIEVVADFMSKLIEFFSDMEDLQEWLDEVIFLWDRELSNPQQIIPRPLFR
jgi:hypothetical protein